MPKLLRRSSSTLLFVTFALAALGTVSLPASHAGTDRTVVLSLQGLDCASCFGPIEAQLKKVKGTKRVSFDTRTVEATVQVKSSVPTSTLIAAVQRAGPFRAVEGPGQGRWLPPQGFPQASDVTIVSERGEDVPDLDALAVPGKFTVVDFYADWCGPCRLIDKHMAEILATRRDLALRKINIVDWKTPVAKRHLRRIGAIPYVLVYDPAGRRVTEIRGLQLRALDQAIAQKSPGQK